MRPQALGRHFLGTIGSFVEYRDILNSADACLPNALRQLSAKENYERDQRNKKSSDGQRTMDG